jgi:hypothetical protein
MAHIVFLSRSLASDVCDNDRVLPLATYHCETFAVRAHGRAWGVSLNALSPLSHSLVRFLPELLARRPCPRCGSVSCLSVLCGVLWCLREHALGASNAEFGYCDHRLAS